jgi:hypothetical protein
MDLVIWRIMVSAKSESMLKTVRSAQNDAPPKLVVVRPGVIADFRYDDWAAGMFAPCAD